MIVKPLPIFGAFALLMTPFMDERGYFARTYDESDFRSHALCTTFPEHSVAVNRRSGIVRGLHYQADPCDEVKVIRCSRGAIFDVLVDVRPDSETYGCWHGVELREDEGVQIYAPAGVAHGYQTLEERTDVQYLISAPYVAQRSRGYRYDSPSLGIAWPITNALLSARDRSLPLFER